MFRTERQSFIIENQDSVVAILHNLGIPSHLDGYKYLKLILSENLKDEKNFYSFIENKHSINQANVERSIRYAIEVGWNRASYQHIETIFGNSIELMRSKPTNLEFITAVFEQLNDKMWSLFHFNMDYICDNIKEERKQRW